MSGAEGLGGGAQRDGAESGAGGTGAGSVRSPAVKRLMREAAELATAGAGAGGEPGGGGAEVGARPLHDNLFEWHFTVRGPPNTEFAGGLYHGRILLPHSYPMRPPHIILLTPNGRFEVNRKICLSISGHHPETWQPSWSIRTALVALQAFLPTPAEGTIGSLEYSAQERRRLARHSLAWRCDHCGDPQELLLPGESDCAPDRSPEPSRPPRAERPAERVHSEARLPLAVSPPRDSLDSFRDCVIVCLIISIAVFVYRRFNLFSDMLNDF